MLLKGVKHLEIDSGNVHGNGIGEFLTTQPAIDGGVDLPTGELVPGQDPVLENAVEVPRLGEVVQLLDPPVLDNLLDGCGAMLRFDELATPAPGFTPALHILGWLPVRDGFL